MSTPSTPDPAAPAEPEVHYPDPATHKDDPRWQEPPATTPPPAAPPATGTTP